MQPARRVKHLCSQLTAANDQPELGFDPDAVRERYEHERDIRLARRPEGTAQYVHIEALAEKDERFARMLDDPWAEKAARAPKNDAVEVARRSSAGTAT